MIFDVLNKADWEASARYLSGEMNDGEMKTFEQRIVFSESNDEYFKKVKTDWEKMENLKDKNTFDTDKAWGNLSAKILQDNHSDTKNKFRIGRLAEIAAIFVVGILLTALTYYMFSDTGKLNWQVADTYEYTDIKQLTLSDGSVVYLNANSKLYYPDTFKGNTRTVEFEGDGFFEIAKKPSKPFIIKAKKAEIRVLGTSFNINTKKGENEVEVLVETGKVRLAATKNKKAQLILEPGFLGKLNNDQLTKEKNTDPNYLSWKTRYFDFSEGIRLIKAIEILNRAYNVNIQCNDAKICSAKLETTFDNESIDTILKIICELKHLKYVKEENNIVLIP